MLWRRSFLDLALTLMIGGTGLMLVAEISGLGLSQAVKAIGAYAVFGLAVAIVFFRAFPLATLGAANRVTLLRAGLACLFVGLVGDGARVTVDVEGGQLVVRPENQGDQGEEERADTAA